MLVDGSVDVAAVIGYAGGLVARGSGCHGRVIVSASVTVARSGRWGKWRSRPGAKEVARGVSRREQGNKTTSRAGYLAGKCRYSTRPTEPPTRHASAD